MNEETIVFRSGNSMAVRLIGQCRLPRGMRVRERREGRSIVLEPIEEWPKSFLDSLGAWNEDLPRIQPSSPRDPFK